MGIKENLVTFIAEGIIELLIIFKNSSKQLIVDIKPTILNTSIYNSTTSRKVSVM